MSPISSVDTRGVQASTAPRRPAVSEFEGGTVIDPNSATMYVGFSGVLHCGDGLMDGSGCVTLNSGRQPFERAHYFSDALAPYPSVRLASNLLGVEHQWSRNYVRAR